MYGLGQLIKKAAVIVGAFVIATMARPYIVGVDISWVLEDESLGAKYYDDGKQQDLFDILQNNGINFIRVRTFVNSCIGYAKENYSGASSNVCWCDLEHTIALAKRIKAHNMGFFLDFHMSDTWASIGHQNVPASWKGKSNAEMGKLAYNHVKTTMDALMKQGLRPDMVQVGNEINSKVAGVAMSKMSEFANIINSGVKAVREIDPSIKIVMQHGQPRPEKGFASWYEKIHANIDYDAICGSTYGTTNNGQDWRDMFGLVVKNKKAVLSCEYTGARTALVNSVFNEFGELGWGTFVWEPTRYSDKPMFDRNGQKYTANARLKELRDIAKKYNATLPDWVKVGKTTQVKVPHVSLKTTASVGGHVEQSIVGDSVPQGSSLTLKAVPLNGWEFTGWKGDLSGKDAETTIKDIQKGLNVQAEFKFIAKDSLHYEAEDALYNATIFEDKHQGFSGKGYANLDNKTGSSITFGVCLPNDGEQQMRITFANGSTANRAVSISVNGEVQVKSLDMPSTGEWTDWNDTIVILNMPAGASTVKIESLTEDGGPNIDKIEFVVAKKEKTTAIAKRILQQNINLHRSSKTFFVNGRSTGRNKASHIRIYTK